MSSDPITLEEYDLLCSFARELNEWVPPTQVKAPAAAPSDARGNRPGDDFNRRATWAEILEPHGWQVARTSGDVTYWTRPGKDPRHGCSATTGKCSSEAGGDLLYVFSANAGPLDNERAYSKFSALAVLNHGGDWSAAARELGEKGYGERSPELQMKAVQLVTPTPQLPPDDDVKPDYDFATADDLRRLGVSLKWTWPGWLQEGAVNLLAAEGGSGKTRFVMDLVKRVATGGEWPDGSPCPRFDGQYIAMWVAADSNHAELLSLSEEFGVADRIAYSGTKADPTGYTTLDGLGDYVLLHKKIKAAAPLFLVIDTCGGATSKNLAKQEDARAFFKPAADIAQRRHMCVIGVTHLNANKTVLGKRAQERVRVVMRMYAKTPNDKDCPRRIEVLKSNSLIPPPLGCLLGPVGNTYDVPAPPSPEDERDGVGQTSAPGGDSRSAECMTWLRERLADSPKRVHELRTQAENAGFSPKTLYKAKDAIDLIETQGADGKKWWGLASGHGI